MGKRLLTRTLTAALMIAATALVGGTDVPQARAAAAEQVLFERDTLGYNCFRIPAIVRTGQGTLLAFAEARKAPSIKSGGAEWCDDAGDIDLVVRRSTDNGGTWGDPIVVSDAANETHGNPVPFAVGDRVVLLSTHNPTGSNTPRTPFVQYSDDDGATWSDPVDLGGAIDKPDWGWYATGPGHGITLTAGSQQGRLIAGINAGTPDGDIGGVVYSDDGGETWQLGGTRAGSASMIPQEISPVELTDGRIHLAARNQSSEAQNPRAYAVSEDGGATLASPFAEVEGLDATPRVQGSTLRVGDTIVLSTPVDATLRKNMTIYSSYDETASWTDPITVTTDRAGYSDLVELGDGVVGLLYEAGAYPGGDARDEIRFTDVTL